MPPDKGRFPGSPGSRWALLGIAVLTLAVYANSLSNGLVYDDHYLIEANRQVREADLRGIFTTHYWAGYGGNETGQYRPLVILSFAIQHALHGVEPFGYHLANVLLHALNGLLVYLLVLEFGSVREPAPLPPLPSIPESRGTARGKGAAAKGRGSFGFVALAAAILFAIHPVHAEAGAGVTFGRADLLAAFFGFLSLLLHARGRSGRRKKGIREDAPDAGAGRVDRRALLSFGLFAMALLCKESAAGVIGLFLLYDVAASGRETLPGAIGEALRDRWRIYAACAGLFAIYLGVRGALGIGFSAGSLSPLNNPLAGAPFAHRIWTAARLVLLYAGLILFPVRLSVDYSYRAIPVAVSPLDPTVLAGVCLAVGALVLAVRLFRRSRPAFLAIGVAAVLYAPVSQVGSVINALFQERFLYAPLLGPCLLAGLGLDWIRKRRRAAAFGILATAAILLSARTIVRNADWRDDLSLFSSAIEAYPNSAKSQGNLADVLALRGQLDRAEAAYRQALRLMEGMEPEGANLHNNLGNVYQLQGRLEEAAEAYRRATTLQPDYAEAHKGRGVVCLKRGDPAGAAACFERVTALQPGDAEAHYNLGLALQGIGRVQDAIRSYERAVALRADYAEAHYNLGNAYRHRGDTAAAILAYRRFLQVWRGDARVADMARREIQALEHPGSEHGTGSP